MRTSVRTYLSQAKRHLGQASTTGRTTRFVVGNESADLDSIACALVYGYIQTSTGRNHAEQEIVIPVTNIPAADLSLRPELTALLHHAGVEPEHLITLDDIQEAKLQPEQTSWTLVDHNVMTGSLAKSFNTRVTGVIDHHDDEKQIPAAVKPRVIDRAGSCCSLIANYCRPALTEVISRASSIGAAIAQDDSRLLDDAAYASTWTAHVAKLAIGPILIDTINMTDENKVTDSDRKALRFLEALVNIAPRVGKDYDRDKFFQELDKAKTDVDGLSVRDQLRKDYKEWTEGDIKLGTAVIVKPLSYIEARESTWTQTVKDFAAERSVDIMAITTAYSDADDSFHRELALFCQVDGTSLEAVQRFVQTRSEELRLEDLHLDLSGASFKYAHAWTQHNLAASRKQTAPMLREALRS